MAQRRMNGSGIVYSTDPGFRAEEPESVPDTAPADQKLYVRLETKQRAGKAVTVVKGFAVSTPRLEQIGKDLKSSCGTGGSVKDGEILIQGDHRDKIVQWLIKKGFRNTIKK